ncbi:MFS transporter [Desemzia sp. RIT804]|uniref:MFS transporter n=1 Tax=Desemzia sp. RIT 804 TaxID=2810209 RepID=UPI00194E40BC|nr:MFS transporter [Desemzia sp. RIT 804]MBM6614341.1 MFS transporter [Desemzia sp. RIT 804]
MTLILVIVYLSFISLGLPDSLLGSAWPAMYQGLEVSVSSVSWISVITTGGTVVSSLLSGRMLKRFGTGKVTLVSILLTAVALLGFAFSSTFWWLCVLALPLGLGAGSVDAALNNFVALYFKASHMSWLHSFWGLGATLGPLILSFFIARGSWQNGYLVIGIIQLILVGVIATALPRWKKIEKVDAQSAAEEKEHQSKKSVIRKSSVKLSVLSFFLYSAIETTTGLWSSTYLVEYKALTPELAARWTSLFFLGITVGRLVSGFLTYSISNKNLIRLGQLICASGGIVLLLPLPDFFAMLGLLLIGLGCAPMYPSMMHDTPNRFGRSASQSVMGLQVAFAYVGSSIMPLIFSGLVSVSTIALFPYYILFSIVLMTWGSEKMNHYLSKKQTIQ